MSEVPLYPVNAERFRGYSVRLGCPLNFSLLIKFTLCQSIERGAARGHGAGRPGGRHRLSTVLLGEQASAARAGMYLLIADVTV